jgi:hypothetical protein
MFRRRAATPTAAPAGPAEPSRPDLAAELADAGWVLPRGVGADGPPRWTLVGTVASPTATAVDPAGLVAGEGWSLDWWIGADDRWHLPAREAAVRQQPVDDAPVVETLVRIPGGDAAHRAYGIRAPRPEGDDWVVVEIENRTPVPFAVALVVRPFVADGVGSVGDITIEPVDGGRGRDVAHLVRVDGRPAVVLPRRPARMAAGNRADGDLVGTVTDGTAGADLITARCPDGLATVALVLPLPHTAVLRVAMPVGEVGTGPVPYPSVVPDAATVAAGWEVHRRGPRFEVPDSRLEAALRRARAQVHLAHDGSAVRRDGHRSPDLEPGATEVLLGALDVLDRPDDVGNVVARWIDRLADPVPGADTAFLDVVARHWLLHRTDPLLDWMLPEVSAAVERIDRDARRGRLDPAAARRAAGALAAAARMLAAAGQPEAGTAVGALAGRLAAGSSSAPSSDARDGSATERLLAVADALDRGDPDAPGRLDAVLAEASTTGTWPGPGPGGRAVGTDLAAAAALVHAARALLVVERADGLDLVPVHPDAWYGGGFELHDAPTAWGRLSYAVRWHGTRPAVLWDLAPHPGPAAAAVLRAPGLDAHWSTTEARGEALLAEVAPPDGLDLVRVVAEHPDIDPEMRRPGDEPAPPPPALPEGGTFS